METQETRSERLTVAVTPGELNDARLVAAFRNVAVSNLLRDMPLTEVVGEAERLRALAATPLRTQSAA